MRRKIRGIGAIAIVACSVMFFTAPSNASSLPTGPGVTSIISESFDTSTMPSTISPLVAPSSSALLPCLSSVTSGTNICSSQSGVVDDGNGGQLILTDTTTNAPNASGVLVKQTFSSTNALYAQFDTQSYGNGGGGRTIWLINAEASTPSIPFTNGSAGYGTKNGGIPGAVLGITLDASGESALTNATACPNVGWDANKSSPNQVVVRARDTSATAGTSGYCFVSSSEQKFGALSTKTGTLGSLHQSSSKDGWQRVFVNVLPPSFTNDAAELTVAIDAADGRGLVTVLDIELPTWVWPTDGSVIPENLRLGISASNPTDGTVSDVVAVRNLRAVAVAPSASEPTAPRNVGVQWSNPVGGLVSGTVSWSTPLSNGYSPITGYTATLNGDTCSPSSLVGPTFSCTITSIPAGDAYTVSVIATNSVGDSPSGVAISSVNAQSQSITAPTLTPVIYGAPAIRMVATASSGLPVTLSASGACSLSNAQIVVSQVGTCTVTVTQSGSLSYEAAPPVTRTFAVSPAAATIKVSEVSAVVDGSAHPVLPTVTPNVVPLSVSYCPVEAPTSCSSTAPSEVGSYIATVKSSSANYTAAPAVTYIDILPSMVNMPPEAGGPQAGTNGNVTMTLQSPSDTSPTPSVQTTGRGFTPGAPINIAVTGQESFGTFTIPAPGSASSLLSVLKPSSSASNVTNSEVVLATTPTDLSDGNSIAFPFGGFPGSGSYIVLTFTSGGFIPGTTVSSILHSTPLVLATAVADANGNVTLRAPVPASYAGQSHKIVLAGTYLASTTTANGDGSVSAETALPQSLLDRLEANSQLVITAVDQNDPTNFAKSYITIGAPSVTTTTVAGSANDVLQAPPLVPTDNPGATMKQVTNLVAVAATVAATASVAASVAGSVGSIRVPSGGAPSAPRPTGGSSSSSSASGSSDSSGPLSTQQIGAAIEDVALEDLKRGDASKLWRAPGHQFIDKLSALGPVKIAKASPMLAAAISDGSYLRAMLGSISAALPILGVVFAIFNVIQTHGYPVPGDYTTFAVLMFLGALDGWSGLASTLTILIGAIVTGHIFSLSMAVAFSLLAALLFGTAIIVKGVRPLLHESFNSFHDKWKRAGDFVVGPLFGGFLATQLVGASASAAGLNLPITKHALFIGVVVGIAFFVRYAVSTVAVLYFPTRLTTVTAHAVPDQAGWATISSQIMRQVFTALLLHAFLGWSWVLLILIGIQIAQGFLAPKVSGQLPKVLYRLVPRGVVNILVMATLGTLGGRLMSHLTTDGFWQVAGLLIFLGVIGLIYAMVSVLDGEGYPPTWPTRIAGIAVVVITALQLTGRLI